MAVHLTCPKCDYQDDVPHFFRGQCVKCPKCGQEFAVSPQALAEPIPKNRFATLDVFRIVHKPLDSGLCPNCKHPISPRPKRGRKCSFCGEQFYIRSGVLLSPADARKHDEEFGNPIKWMTRPEKIENRRQWVLRDWEQHRSDPEFVWGMRIQTSGDHLCCEYCCSHADRDIPLSQCSPAAFPPFEACTNAEDGCRCMICPLFNLEYVVACPHCKKSCRIWDRYFGKHVRCPHCNMVFQPKQTGKEELFGPK